MKDVLKKRAVFILLTVSVIAVGVSLNLNLRRDIKVPGDERLSQATLNKSAKSRSAKPRLDEANEAPIAREVRQQVKEIYASADFAEKDSALRLIPRKKVEEPKETPTTWLDWLARLLSPTVGEVIRWVMWALAAVALVLVLFFGVRYLRDWQRGRATAFASDGNLAARRMLRLDELPDDVLPAAQLLWERGERVAALSLLYRGALKHLLDIRGLKLKASFTEAECLRAVEAQLDGPTVHDFATVTHAWSAAAYAARPPATFAELAGLYRTRFVAPSGS
jgi:hypothetical protein